MSNFENLGMDKNICVHGHDKRLTRCVMCEDPAALTAAARPDLSGVVMSAVATPGASGLINEVSKITRDHIEARKAGTAYRDVLSRWTPDILDLQLDAYTVGYLDGMKAERARRANELRQESTTPGTAPAGCSIEEQAQPREASCGGGPECGETPEKQVPHEGDACKEQEQAGEVSVASQGLLERGIRRAPVTAAATWQEVDRFMDVCRRWLANMEAERISRLEAQGKHEYVDCPKSGCPDCIGWTPQPDQRPFTWILYDGRAASGDTDDAAVLEAFSSKRDLKSNLFRTWAGHDGVLFEYDIQNGNELLNGRMVGHLREGKATLLAKCSRHPSAGTPDVSDDPK